MSLVNLTINGNTKLNNSSWDIHFENVVPNQNNVSLGNEDSEAAITINDNTEVTYNVTLSTPGDFYEFEVDAVNAGTIDASITSIVKKYNDTVVGNYYKKQIRLLNLRKLFLKN